MSRSPMQSDAGPGEGFDRTGLDLANLVFMPAPRATWVLVGNEVVIYTADVAMTYVLNPTASLVWQCLDGASTVSEILRDVADVFQVDEQQVFDEFGPVLHEWREAGLVAQGAA